MPIYYKIDVVGEIKKLGYNKYTITTEAMIPQTAVKAFAQDKSVSFLTLARVCELLHKQPGDIVGYMPIDDFVALRMERIKAESDPSVKREMELETQLAKIKNLP